MDAELEKEWINYWWKRAGIAKDSDQPVRVTPTELRMIKKMWASSSEGVPPYELKGGVETLFGVTLECQVMYPRGRKQRGE